MMPKLAPIAAKALSHTLLMFDNFYDVEEKAKAGNEYAKQVMQSWADAEWFLNRPALAEKTDRYRLQSHWRNQHR
ncbi:bifunctional aconitate hydratase 2/2-methylisocitrate dehydratase [Escherichia coli]|nr:bifunctional aconitate hydratase 2/2-methylisocitrate dehydratase [Escherichia coli]